MKIYNTYQNAHIISNETSTFVPHKKRRERERSTRFLNVDKILQKGHPIIYEDPTASPTQQTAFSV